MKKTTTGQGFTIVIEDLPPRILVRGLDGKIRAYIDARTGVETSATKADLEALGVPLKDLEDVKP